MKEGHAIARHAEDQAGQTNRHGSVPVTRVSSTAPPKPTSSARRGLQDLEQGHVATADQRADRDAGDVCGASSDHCSNMRDLWRIRVFAAPSRAASRRQRRGRRRVPPASGPASSRASNPATGSRRRGRSGRRQTARSTPVLDQQHEAGGQRCKDGDPGDRVQAPTPRDEQQPGGQDHEAEGAARHGQTLNRVVASTSNGNATMAAASAWNTALGN